MTQKKKNSEPKRHHYIPSGYLKGFTCSGDSVFYFDKNQPKKGIVRRNRYKILKIPHFYSETHHGSKRPILENKLASEIDNKIPSFVCDIENAIAFGSTIENYASLREFSERLFLNFFYRSPYTREKAKFHPFAKISRLFARLSFVVSNFRSPNQQELKEQYENMIQGVIGSAHQNNKSALSKLNLCFVAPHHTERFITGSNPILVQFPKLIETVKSRSAAQRFYFLPLSPKAGLLFSDQPIGNGILYLDFGSASYLNSLVFYQSTKVISHDYGILSHFVTGKR